MYFNGGAYFVGSTGQTRQASICDELGRKETETSVNSSELSHGCGACLSCKHAAAAVLSMHVPVCV